MQIRLKNKEVFPLIQGGMGVGISLSNLAGEVALNNCIGTISAVNVGYREKDFYKDPIKSNLNALKKEIKKAKEISKGNGLIAVNIMTAINDFEKFVKTASDEDVDLIICGAGLPLNLPEYVKEDTLIAPIVSSARAFNLIAKIWMKKYNRLPDLVIVEGPLAGGHLGFKEKDLDLELSEIVKEVKKSVEVFENEYDKKIYIFAAGGIRNKFDRESVINSGADGIQVGTPFIATYQCDASLSFKETIINSSDSDIKIINSPVGMIARAIDNDFIKKTKDRIPSRRCINCLKTCNPSTTPYCIKDALNDSASGAMGLVFSGSNINSINSLKDVKEVIDSLMEEI